MKEIKHGTHSMALHHKQVARWTHSGLPTMAKSLEAKTTGYNDKICKALHGLKLPWHVACLILKKIDLYKHCMTCA